MCFDRRFPALVVVVFSVVVLACGAVLVILSTLFYTKESVLNVDMGEYTELIAITMDATYALLMVLSTTAVVVGAGGTLCLCRPIADYRCFSVVYGFALLGVWLAFVIIGVLMTVIGASGVRVAQGFCDGEPIDDRFQSFVDTL